MFAFHEVETLLNEYERELQQSDPRSKNSKLATIVELRVRFRALVDEKIRKAEGGKL